MQDRAAPHAQQSANPGRATRRARLELWAIGALFLLAAEVAVAIYLGSRPGGRGPVLAYYAAPPVLGGAALLLGSWGVVTALRRKPFLRPARLLGFSILALVIGTASYPLPFPAAREHAPTHVQLEFPLDGEWTAEWGGVDSNRNLLARSRPDRRFGYDLVLERDGARHSGAGERLEEWFAFGAEVRAPCAGTVVATADDCADHAPGERSPPESDLGNHVVLEIAPGEFLFLANLQRGSIAVAKGKHVERGERLGAVGNSGTQRFTSGPHLALHLQDSPEPHWGQGIPIAFHGALVEGRPVDAARPRGRSLIDPEGVRGERVRRAD